jgi:hypothetical protein
LLNQRQMSPGLGPADLPVHPRPIGPPHGYSHASSSSSLNLARRGSPLIQEMKPIEFSKGQPFPSVPWSAARATHTRSILTADRNQGPPRSPPQPPMRHPPSRSPSLLSLPLPNYFAGEETDENRVSIVSDSSYGSANTDNVDSATPVEILAAPQRSISQSASASSSYSQCSVPSRPTSASTGAPSSTTGPNNLRDLPNRSLASNQPAGSSPPLSPGQDSVLSMMASAHDHPDQEVDLRSPTSGAALPPPRFSSGFGPTGFQLHLSDPSRKQSVDVGDLPDIVGGRRHPLPRQGSVSTVMSAATARPPRDRNDSVASDVDMTEWRKLVMNAAGKH